MRYLITYAAFQPNLLPFILGLVSAGLAVLAAGRGADLVYRLRVVDDDAHLEASNSVSRSGVADVTESPR